MAKARVGIGIDIGTSAVRAAQVSLAKNPPSIERFAQIPLPPGAVVDGEIADPAVVTHTLTEVWKAGGFHIKEANLTISNQKVVARAVEVPYMDPKELRGAIGFQIQEQVPIPIEDAVIDYQVIEEFEGEEGEKMLRVLVVAAVRDMVKAFVDAVEAAHIRVNSVDFTALGLIRSLGDAGVGATGTDGEAIIDIGASVTTIVVHEGGVTRLARVLGAGGHDLTMALSDSLGISAMEAEKLKMRVGVSLSDEEAPAVEAQEEPIVEAEMAAQEQAPVMLASTGTEGTQAASAGSDPAAYWKWQSGGVATQEHSGPAESSYGYGGGNEQAAMNIIEAQVGQLVDQIRGSLNYYLEQSPDARISRLVLAGGTSKLFNLRNRLATALSLPVEQGSPLRKLTLAAVLPHQAEMEPLMGACVGAAMGVQP